MQEPCRRVRARANQAKAKAFLAAGGTVSVGVAVPQVEGRVDVAAAAAPFFGTGAGGASI
jgi:hypothetical protein